MNEMFNLDDCLAFITCQSAKIFAQALERRFRSYNIKRTQWIALYYIYTSHSITQHELAEKMSIKEPTVARLLNELEKENYLIRSGTETDKRIKQLSLTENGKRICTKLIPVAEKFKNDTIDGISQKDLQILKDALNTMVENAQKKKS